MNEYDEYSFSGSTFWELSLLTPIFGNNNTKIFGPICYTILISILLSNLILVIIFFKCIILAYLFLINLKLSLYY